jgi:prepilin-type processing-associated H-X9-DG protein
LLLPYLDKDLAKRFHYDQAWNSKANRMVSDLTIGVFQCPGQEPMSREPTTNYMMVVGPHTISNGVRAHTMSEITDGPADTILVAEVADSTIWWAEPEDLDFQHMNFKINGSKRQSISSYHPGGANCAFCDEHTKRHDGFVRFVKDNMNPQLVKAMLTIDGDEEVPTNR